MEMGFGLADFDGFVPHENTEAPSQVSSMEGYSNEQEGPFGSNNFFVPLTMVSEHSSLTNPLLRCNLVYGDSSQQQLLLYSSLVPQDDGLAQTLSSQTFSAFPYYQSPPSFAGIRGYGSESMERKMYEDLSGGTGAFTPSQLRELGLQTLIYSYISANMTVPPHLLIRPLQPFGLPASSPGFCPPPTMRKRSRRGGYADPEPGRCRRTDGKKWRCSKNVIPDRKYCERHINRGRRRPRNPVEVQKPSAE